MRWPSPWSVGVPGWHAECSAMSTKYLGEPFDIHGGGMDLLFPHHECEIAQSVAANGKDAVKYWMHNNMITINGQKMGKSLGNFITLEELFTGSHKLLEQSYGPMTIRFFMLQAQYRSTLDFSNEALQAAEKGLTRLLAAGRALSKIKPSEKSTVDVSKLKNEVLEALCDDLNSPIAIAILFDWVRNINSLVEGKETITEGDLKTLVTTFNTIVKEILGLVDNQDEGSKNAELTGKLIEMLLEMRVQAKTNKDYATSDKIRDELNKLGVKVMDTKDGFDWEV
jgi:cysteinyl-tRNA synthetase